MWPMVASTGVMAFLFAFFAVWPLLGATGALVAFVGSWALGAAYLLRKGSPIEVLGSGFNATAAMVVLTPIEAYLPRMLEGTELAGAAGSTAIVQGATGLLTWSVACGLAAAGMYGIGRYCKGVAARRELQEFRMRRWYAER